MSIPVADPSTPRSRIADLLQIPDTDAWTIRDVDGSMYLLGIGVATDTSIYGFVDGLIVDLDAGMIVASSGTIPDIDATDDVVASSEWELHPGFDGPRLRRFNHNGVTYHSTDFHLDANRDAIITPRGVMTYLEIFQDLGGDTIPVSEDGRVQTFIVSFPEFQVGSQIDVGSGWLVQMETLPILTLEEAQAVLSGTTSSSDPRLGSGEAVLASRQDGSWVRLVSPAYRWRCNLIGLPSQRRTRQAALSNARFIRTEYPEELEVYTRRFPMLPGYPIDTPEHRLHHVMTLYIQALPPSQRHQSLNPEQLQRSLHRRLDRLKMQLRLLDERTDIDSVRIPSRAQHLLRRAHRDIDYAIGNGSLVSNPMERAIDVLVESEEGVSAYGLDLALSRLFLEDEGDLVPNERRDISIESSSSTSLQSRRR